MVNKQENTESGSKLLDLPQQLTAGDLSGIMDVAPSEVIKELIKAKPQIKIYDNKRKTKINKRMVCKFTKYNL